ncbi:MAG: MFS transporter [Gammaproteobacteria bacterium]|nr:MFS transporter [Gammaproteobacteria bacterium]
MKKFIPSKVHSSLFFAWFVCALAALFYTYEYLLRIEPGIMVKQLRLYFAVGDGGLGLLASMYYWAYTPLQLVVGIVTDRFGARRVLISAIIACVIGTWIFGLTHSYLVASAARFLIGMGSAFAFVGALKLAADWLPRHYFSLFVGLCTSLGMLGAMFGETAMSWTIDHLGWHPVIADSVWLGLVLIGIFLVCVYDKHEFSGKIREIKPLNFKVLGSSLLKILSSKTILQAGFIGCALYLSLSLLAEQWGNTYFQKALDINAQAASYYVDMIFLGWFIGSPMHGYLSEKFGSRRRTLFYGCVLSCLSLLPIILMPQYLPHWMLAVLLFLFAFFSSAEISCFAIARDLVELRLTATAVGFMNACVMVSGMIIQPLFAYCLNVLSADHKVAHYSLGDYQVALLIIPVFLIIACATALRMKDTYELGINARRLDKIHL